MSFFRHGEIYRPMDSRNVPGRPWHDRPRPHRYDEFPAGYSSAGCAPAEPASASPAEAHLAGIGSSSTIELQRTVNRLLTPCLTHGDNPKPNHERFDHSSVHKFGVHGCPRGGDFLRVHQLNYTPLRMAFGATQASWQRGSTHTSPFRNHTT